MKQQPRVAVAMLGARMHYAVPRILNSAGMLERLYTDSYIGNKRWLEQLISLIPEPRRGTELQRLLGRKEPHIPPNKVTSFDGLGLEYAIARRRAHKHPQRTAVFRKFNTRFNRAIICRGFGGADTVWGFNTASVEIFEAAKRDGLNTILEQTILPGQVENQLLKEVSEEFPGWQPGTDASDVHLGDRERAEWEIADQIVAGSQFVADGMVQCGVDAKRIKVIPYGINAANFSLPELEPEQPKRPLRLLFVGEVGLRKGVPYLLDALLKIPPGTVETKLAGGIVLDRNKLTKFQGRAEFLGAVPRSSIPRLFDWADVFVLPSIVEGSATVTYEALVSGVPVITTPNAGSIVVDGQNGKIVPVRDTEALADAISGYVYDSNQLMEHKKFAIASRAEADIARYERDLLEMFRSGKT